MKKVIAFPIVILILTICLCGCIGNTNREQFRYSGNDADLYTEAINSILGTKGWDKDGELGYLNPLIEVVEEDLYGRKLFLYYEGSAPYHHYVLLVSQKTENGYVYYYPDYNFTIGEEEDTVMPQDASTEQSGYTYYYPYNNFRAKFSDNQIRELKTANDWDKEITIDKCVKQATTREKADPLNDTEKATLYKEVFGESDSKGYRSIFFLTQDDEGRLLYLAKYRYSQADYKIVLKDGGSIHSISITNIFAYQNELAAFKRDNKWIKS